MPLALFRSRSRSLSLFPFLLLFLLFLLFLFLLFLLLLSQNHYVATVGDGILVPPPRSARVDLLYPGSSSATSSSNSSPAFPAPQLEPTPTSASTTTTTTTTPNNANGAVVIGNNLVEVDAQQVGMLITCDGLKVFFIDIVDRHL